MFAIGNKVTRTICNNSRELILVCEKSAPENVIESTGNGSKVQIEQNENNELPSLPVTASVVRRKRRSPKDDLQISTEISTENEVHSSTESTSQNKQNIQNIEEMDWPQQDGNSLQKINNMPNIVNETAESMRSGQSTILQENKSKLDESILDNVDENASEKKFVRNNPKDDFEVGCSINGTETVEKLAAILTIVIFIIIIRYKINKANGRIAIYEVRGETLDNYRKKPKASFS